MRQQGRLLDEFLAFLREWAHSAPEVNSRPALLSSGVEVATLVVDPGSGLFFFGFAGVNAPRAVFRTIAFTQNGEVYTVDASAELFCLKIWTLFLLSPC